MGVVLKRVAIGLGALMVSATAAADIILESASLGETGVTSGWALGSQYIGARFVLEEETIINCAGGHLYGDGPFFGAFVALTGPSDLPDGDPFTTDTIVAFQIDPEPTSSDVLAEVGVALPAGTYGFVIGGEQFGATGTGGLPFTDQTDTGQATYFYWNSGGFWLDGGNYQGRFVVANGADCPGGVGATTPVPALSPWAVLLMLAGVLGTAFVVRSRFI